jgi:hypothetical protein
MEALAYAIGAVVLLMVVLLFANDVAHGLGVY